MSGPSFIRAVAASSKSMKKRLLDSSKTVSFRSMLSAFMGRKSHNSMERWLVRGVRDRWQSTATLLLYDMEFWQLTATVLLAYLAVTTVFTVLLYPALFFYPDTFTGDSSEHLSPLAAVFCMCLAALAQTSVDLTELTPASAYTITVTTIAHFVGVMMGAVLLGVLINRASVPTARVIFSDNCLLTSRDGEAVLMLRIGNTRGNFLLNPEIRVGYLQVCHTMEGENIMKMQKLELDEPPAMAPCINVACRITPDSPLFGKTYWDLEAEGAAFYIALSATDNRHYQEVYARKFYLVEDIRINCRFADAMKATSAGARVVDFRRFNKVVENAVMPLKFGLTVDDIRALNGSDVSRPVDASAPSTGATGAEDSTKPSSSASSGPTRTLRRNATGAVSSASRRMTRPKHYTQEVAESAEPSLRPQDNLLDASGTVQTSMRTLGMSVSMSAQDTAQQAQPDAAPSSAMGAWRSGETAAAVPPNGVEELDEDVIVGDRQLPFVPDRSREVPEEEVLDVTEHIERATGTRGRGPNGVFADFTDSENEAEDGYGSATSSAPELHLHEGSAQAARRAEAAARAAEEDAGPSPPDLISAAAETLQQINAQVMASVAKVHETLTDAVSNAVPSSVGGNEDAVEAGGASVRGASRDPSPSKPDDAVEPRVALVAAPTGGPAAPASDPELRSSDSAAAEAARSRAKLAGGVRAVLAARAWRNRIAKPVPEDSLLEGSSSDDDNSDDDTDTTSLSTANIKDRRARVRHTFFKGIMPGNGNASTIVSRPSTASVADSEESLESEGPVPRKSILLNR